MRKLKLTTAPGALAALAVFGALNAAAAPAAGLHPDAGAWPALFADDLSNAEDAKGAWRRDADGCLVADRDVLLFTKRDYGPFVLDFEFKFDPGANSGVYIYASDLKNLIPNKIEVQLLDNPSPRWKTCTPHQRNAALYGHATPKLDALKPTGEWNRMTIFAQGKNVRIVLNGSEVIDEDLSRHVSAKTNPDGTAVPALHVKPWAEIATRGRIGLQGRHQGAATAFRNVRIKEGEWK